MQAGLITGEHDADPRTFKPIGERRCGTVRHRQGGDRNASVFEHRLRCRQGHRKRGDPQRERRTGEQAAQRGERALRSEQSLEKGRKSRKRVVVAVRPGDRQRLSTFGNNLTPEEVGHA